MKTLTHPAYDLRKKVINADEVSYTAKFINIKDIPPTPEMIQTRDLLESALRKLKPDRQFKVDIDYERPGRTFTKYKRHGGVDAHPGERDTRQPYQFLTLEEEGLSVYKPNPDSASALLEEALNRARLFTYESGMEESAMDMDLIISALESVQTIPESFPRNPVDYTQIRKYREWLQDGATVHEEEVDAFIGKMKQKRNGNNPIIPNDPSLRLGIGIWRPDETGPTDPDMRNLFIQKRLTDWSSDQSPFDGQAIVINLKP